MGGHAPPARMRGSVVLLLFASIIAVHGVTRQHSGERFLRRDPELCAHYAFDRLWGGFSGAVHDEGWLREPATLLLRGGDSDTDVESPSADGSASGSELDAGGDGSSEGEDPGAALGDWKEVAAALKDSRRELKIEVSTETMPQELQDKLWACKELNRLVISGGAIRELPERIAELSELTTLIISDNALESLPDALGELSSLRVLEAGGNRLAALPATLASSCPLLEVLDVSRNQVHPGRTPHPFSPSPCTTSMQHQLRRLTAAAARRAAADESRGAERGAEPARAQGGRQPYRGPPTPSPAPTPSSASPRRADASAGAGARRTRRRCRWGRCRALRPSRSPTTVSSRFPTP